MSVYLAATNRRHPTERALPGEYEFHATLALRERK